MTPRPSNRRGPLTVVLAVAVAVLAACGSTRQEAMDAPALPPMQATADDVVTATAVAARTASATVLSSEATQSATVTVTDDALPEGLDGADVTATVYSLDSPDDGVAGITFDLGPDGATFEAPVLLQWEGPWSASATYVLEAAKADGTPIPDARSTEANSVSALRIEPTGPDTARYTLPVTHFSSWSLYAILLKPGPTSRESLVITAVGYAPDEVTTGRPRSAAVGVRLPKGAPLRCVHGYVSAVSGPATVRFTDDGVDCEGSTDRAGDYDLPMSIACTGTGRVGVTAQVYAYVEVEQGARPTEDEAALRMIRATNDLREIRLSDGWSDGELQFARSAEGGVLLMAPVDFAFSCLPPATPATVTDPGATSTSTTAGAGATSTSATGAGASSTSSTTTPVPTTERAADAATSSTAGPATTGGTTTTGARSATTASTAAATSTTTTSVAGTTTTTDPVPASSSTTTTVGSTTTTAPAVWGQTGTWAYNEMGSCNWNGSGGCGWYYSATPGTYVLGPIGSPGARHP